MKKLFIIAILVFSGNFALGSECYGSACSEFKTCTYSSEHFGLGNDKEVTIIREDGSTESTTCTFKSKKDNIFDNYKCDNGVWGTYFSGLASGPTAYFHYRGADCH